MLAGSVVHQELLKKIKVDGVPLSIIQNYRNNPDSVKNLSTPLLKSIHASKSLRKGHNDVIELLHMKEINKKSFDEGKA